MKIELVINVQGLHIPQAVLENMVRVGQIPEKELNWADERKWCKFAIRDNSQAALTCPNLRKEPGGQWCSLNGSERHSPCIFDEPESAVVWQDVRAYVEEGKRKGWLK